MLDVLVGWLCWFGVLVGCVGWLGDCVDLGYWLDVIIMIIILFL